MAISDILNAVVSLKRDEVVENVIAEIEAGTQVDDILNKGLIEIGRASCRERVSSPV